MLTAKWRDWDPLERGGEDPEIFISAQRREIRNILKSYTGYYDLFSELIQNALDAIERRRSEEPNGTYSPRISILIDMQAPSVSVTDNGCGMDESEIRNFLRPNYSFKDSARYRGCKGVGATYLAYGFNHLEVAARHGDSIFCGVLRRGREWVEDQSSTVARPKVQNHVPSHSAFDEIDRGLSFTVRLVGKGIRPRDLSWLGATTAEQWLYVLRVMTPLGGVYLRNSPGPHLTTHLVVRAPSGEESTTTFQTLEYLYPHHVVSRSADLREFLRDQQRRLTRGLDIRKIPPKFQRLHGIWGQWSGAEIIGDTKSDCPIQSRLDEDDKQLARELDIDLYIFLAYSTDLWDQFHDDRLQLRKGQRILRGGLQLATRNMPQGLPITIPMTNNIGFQNLAHVIVHFGNAEPDLGRKGFQPNQVRIAERLAVSAVTAFRRRYELLRKPGVARIFGDELALNDWIREQEEHEKSHPLIITGKGLFMPTEELPIRSTPCVEQDVVALFNQMLSSGLIRGIQLISSSQYKQYDGLFRVYMDPPFDRFLVDKENPLGVSDETFAGVQERLASPVQVLEYKLNLDGLVEELQAEVKSASDIGLVVAWEMGERWKSLFDVTSFLDPDHVHHRQVHGTTHVFTDSVSGSHAFYGVILQDLVNYLLDRNQEIARQRKIYSDDE